MKNQKNKFPILLLITALLCSSGQQLHAQEQSIIYTGNYQDITIPASTQAKYLKLTAVGGDGGKKRAQSAVLRKAGKNVASGKGALVQATFKIGTASNEITPGSTIRFIVGKAGQNREDGATSGAGGGGGTGIAYRAPNGSWTLLMVAGGGGGSSSDCCTAFFEGGPGKAYVRGNEGAGHTNRNTTGGEMAGGSAYLSHNSDDNKFSNGDDLSKNVGWRNGPDQGAPTGASAYTSDDGLGSWIPGGWGFGPGGTAYAGNPERDFSGGGGGFTGGLSGDATGDHSSTGGTSFVNESMNIGDISSHSRGRTTGPVDGYAQYEFTDKAELYKLMRFARDPSKCIDVRDASVHSGSNVELFVCQGSATQSWLFDGQMIKFLRAPGQCLEIQGSTPKNGANVEVWGCNSGTNAQKWIYDGVNKRIRSVRNPQYCVDLVNGNTTDGTNIQLWQCVYDGYKPNQQWTLDGASNSTTDKGVQTIRTVLNTEKCLHIKDGAPVNLANVELWDCMGTVAQQWYFSGSEIKAQGNKNKCFDATGASTANGTNIILYTCNGNANQRWIYDGLTKSIRSGMNVNKCIHIKNGSTANAANAELWDCTGSKEQQFEIK